MTPDVLPSPPAAFAHGSILYFHYSYGSVISIGAELQMAIIGHKSRFNMGELEETVFSVIFCLLSGRRAAKAAQVLKGIVIGR